MNINSLEQNGKYDKQSSNVGSNNVELIDTTMLPDSFGQGLKRAFACTRRPGI